MIIVVTIIIYIRTIVADATAVVIIVGSIDVIVIIHRLGIIIVDD